LSPRTYRMETRDAAAAQTRERILSAARDLLVSEAFSEFTMDAVARKADVSRLTVYYQFESKVGLLEALYNYIAKRGEMEQLADVFRRGSDPLTTLHDFILVFARFWASDRDVIRRLHGLAAIDPDIAQSLRARNERRVQGLRVIVNRYTKANSALTSIEQTVAIDTLHMLTSFETFDALAGSARSFDEAVAILRRLAHHAIGFVAETQG
jgi:AcrR family transcriptional regulator